MKRLPRIDKTRPTMWALDNDDPWLYIVYPDGLVELLFPPGKAWVTSAHSYSHSSVLPYFKKTRKFMGYL